MSDISKFVVMGDPISHSLSPIIHKLFAKQFSIELEYEKMLTNKENLLNKINEFKLSGGTGINLTSPLKEDAVKFVNRMSKRAKRADSINTIHIKNGEIFGDNTDGIGFIRAFRKNVMLKEKKILILGAGGAIKGILPYILLVKDIQIHIVNRTVEKAVEFTKIDNRITAGSYQNIPKTTFDMVINTTSILNNDYAVFKKIDIFANIFFDLQYNKESAFFTWCKERKKIKYISGLSMLVEQAAESFYLWHGVFPDIGKVLTQLTKSENEY